MSWVGLDSGLTSGDCVDAAVYNGCECQLTVEMLDWRAALFQIYNGVFEMELTIVFLVSFARCSNGGSWGATEEVMGFIENVLSYFLFIVQVSTLLYPSI